MHVQIRIPHSLLILAASVTAGTLLVAVTALMGLPESLGSNIPTSDLPLDYAYGLIFAAVGLLLLMILPVGVPDRIALATVWVVKVVVVLVFMLFYENFYWALDTYGYFELPSSSNFVWDGIWIGRGTENLYNLVWLCYQVLPISFHGLKVLFSFVGLIAIYIFYRAAMLFLGTRNILLFYVLALSPSILFWSSILGKDPIGLLGIAIYAFGVVSWYQSHRLANLVWLGTGVLIAMFVRPWLGPILIAPLLVNIVFGRYRLVTKGLVVALAAGALAYTLSVLWDTFAIETARDVLETVDVRSRGLGEGGSGQELSADLTQPAQLIAALPVAMFTALFRPLPGEIPNMFGTLAGVENAFLLGLLLLAIARFRLAELRKPVILWATLLVVCWTVAYAFISYGNLGGAVRFRLQIQPILLTLLLYFGFSRVPLELYGQNRAARESFGGVKGTR